MKRKRMPDVATQVLERKYGRGLGTGISPRGSDRGLPMCWIGLG